MSRAGDPTAPALGGRRRCVGGPVWAPAPLASVRFSSATIATCRGHRRCPGRSLVDAVASCSDRSQRSPPSSLTFYFSLILSLFPPSSLSLSLSLARPNSHRLRNDFGTISKRPRNDLGKISERSTVPEPAIERWLPSSSTKVLCVWLLFSVLYATVFGTGLVGIFVCHQTKCVRHYFFFTSDSRVISGGCRTDPDN